MSTTARFLILVACIAMNIGTVFYLVPGASLDSHVLLMIVPFMAGMIGAAAMDL